MVRGTTEKSAKSSFGGGYGFGASYMTARERMLVNKAISLSVPRATSLIWEMANMKIKIPI